MQNQVHFFKQGLVTGQTEEQKFFNRFSNYIQQWTGRTGDFVLNIPGNPTFELKAETGYTAYTQIPNLELTPNFFIERWSRTNVDGGPWQALNNRCTYYAHVFKDGPLFIFDDIPALLKRAKYVQKLLKRESSDIDNSAYVTFGHKLPRELFADLYRELSVQETDLIRGGVRGSSDKVQAIFKEKEAANEQYADALRNFSTGLKVKNHV